MCIRRERQAVNRSQIAFGARVQHKSPADSSASKASAARARARSRSRCVRMESSGFCKTSHMAIPRAPPTTTGVRIPPLLDGGGGSGGGGSGFALVRAAPRAFSPPTSPYGPSRPLQMQLKTPRDRPRCPAARDSYNVATDTPTMRAVHMSCGTYVRMLCVCVFIRL